MKEFVRHALTLGYGSRSCPFLRFWLVLSLLFSSVFGSIDLLTVPVTGLMSAVWLAVNWMVLAWANCALLLVLCISRRVFAALFVPYLLLAIINAYFGITIGSGVSAVSIEIAMHTDIHMWMSLLTPRLAVCLILAIAAGLGIIIFRVRRVTFRLDGRLMAAMAVVAAGMLPALMLPRVNSFLRHKFPVQTITAWSEYVNNRKDFMTLRPAFDDVAVVCAPDSVPVVVVILGEALRADHLGVNGYGRPTTPLLSTEVNLVSFPHTLTDATYTGAAIPLMMTRAESVTDDECFAEPSFITLFKKAGIPTAWVSNQGYEPSYSYFVHEADTAIFCNASRSPYDFRSWLDTDMLPDFRRLLEGSRQGALIVMQPIGSHWWYNSHYESRHAHFKPECIDKEVKHAELSRIINSYDNTIVATDEFVHDLINGLRQRNALLIFMSDHGEMLGEDGVFLHVVDGEPVRRPAAFVWYSDKYASTYPEKVEALRENADEKIEAGMLFHSVLDGAGVWTEVTERQMSFFYKQSDSKQE